MAKCRQCNCDIPRGQTYHGELYKSLPFCGEKCYNEFILAKQEKPKSSQKDNSFAMLRDYINNLWDGKVNWSFMGTQIKRWRKEYGLDNIDIYLTLKYAIVYENYVIDKEFGLSQFVRFIEPSKEFAEKIMRNREAAKELKDEEVVYVKPTPQRRWIKEEDWDD